MKRFIFFRKKKHSSIQSLYFVQSTPKVSRASFCSKIYFLFNHYSDIKCRMLDVSGNIANKRALYLCLYVNMT